MEKLNGQIRVGTSNVVVPGNKTTFPEAYRLKSRLHYYSTIFNTVEVNSCFYKTPLRTTYEKWTRDVPDDFQFTLKLSKAVTHAKELQSDFTCMDKFISTADGTGSKKGCLLVQFPGKITLDYFHKVEEILQELNRLDTDHQWKKAVEFRHTSWHIGEAYELLDEYSAAMVLHDIPKAKLTELRGKASFTYIRFHGPKGDYRGSYSDQFLKEMAEQLNQWAKDGKDVYAYFNNTIGSAYENAIYLKRYLKQ